MIDEKLQTCGNWVRAFEEDFGTGVSAITWKTDYLQVFKRLPQQELLTGEVLKSIILETKPNTRTRRRYCLTLGKLAKFAELDFDPKFLQGNYSQSKVKPRQLPDDAAIANAWKQIKPAGWRWVVAMLATYGLRPHEVFYLDVSEMQQGEYVIRVTEGKTGGRWVWPFHQEWIEEFNLRDRVLPDVTGRMHADYGHRVAKFFLENELPFRAYDLRHAWAVRTLEYGLDVTLAAQQMGHGVKVHSDIYHAFISRKVHQRAFEALMVKSDRPKAPLS